MIQTRAPASVLLGTWRTPAYDDSRWGEWYDNDGNEYYDDFDCKVTYGLWFITDSVFRMGSMYVETETGNSYRYYHTGSGNYAYTASGSKVTLEDRSIGTISGGNTLSFSEYDITFNKQP